MIPVNELRIGNWVQGDPLSIPTLTMRHNGMLRITGYGIMLIEGGQLQVSPIPLTPEILEAAGFVQGRGDYLIHSTVTLDQSLVCEYRYLLQSDGLHISVGDNDIGIMLTVIKHLHALQNFFYATHGQELTVSPL